MGRTPQGRGWSRVGFLGIVWLFAACSPAAAPQQISTAQIGQPAAQLSSPERRDPAAEEARPSTVVPPLSSERAPTLEVNSPFQLATLSADRVMVTPTLPPTKTTTQTPTQTPSQTPTQSPTPTVTITATATIPQFPTSVVTPVPAVVPQAVPQTCQSAWFFLNPQPAGCPLAAPSANAGVYQTFQNGFMIWVGSTDVIYVFYNDATQPRWQTFRDEFEEGEPSDDPAYANAPTPGTWQPRRGFGMLWRNNAAVRDRIGWTTLQWEQAYNQQVQSAPDGSTFISDPAGGVFVAFTGSLLWERYTVYGGF